MPITCRPKPLTIPCRWIFLAALPLAAAVAIDIPPVQVPLNLQGQQVVVTVAGRISESPGVSVDNKESQTYNLDLHADLGDLQDHATPILQAELNQSNKCGERIEIQNATLAPAAPGARLTVKLHFEKWACFKALGKENAKRLVGGDGSVAVILTPNVEQNGVHLDVSGGDIEADGALGDLLRSGQLGDALRAKLRDELVKAVQKAVDVNAMIPEQVRQFVTIQTAVFAAGPNGRLELQTSGRFTGPLSLSGFKLSPPA